MSGARGGSVGVEERVNLVRRGLGWGPMGCSEGKRTGKREEVEVVRVWGRRRLWMKTGEEAPTHRLNGIAAWPGFDWLMDRLGAVKNWCGTRAAGLGAGKCVDDSAVWCENWHVPQPCSPARS
jgi:hypothetical protein